ncbi:MAG: lysozyme [Rhizobiaceae bacterium]|nr:lysozyme [Rhizobiaceae bacterium]
MKTSQRGLAEIAAHEGIVLSKYKDSVGVWTIGIGHTKNAGSPDPESVDGALSLQEVMEIFARDITKFEKRVTKAFTRKITQSQFDAAVSFDFNTGGIHRASWVKLFNSGNDQSARHAFMKWRKPREIIPRRQAECDLFFKAKYFGKGKVNVYSSTAKGKVLWSSGKRVSLSALSLDKPSELLPDEAVDKQASSLRSILILATSISEFATALSHKILKLFQ